MFWEDVYGRESVKKELKDTLSSGRIAHAQLFTSALGTGGLDIALAYANALLNKKTGQMLPLEKLMQHPDLHFAVPLASTPTVSKPFTKLFLKEWVSFLPHNLFASVQDWLSFLEIEKKEGVISVHEISNILQSLALNSYSGGYKVLIMWLPEHMNSSSANKVLKLLEEPPNKTVFLLVSHSPSDLLPTLISRCQQTSIQGLSQEELSLYLTNTTQKSPEMIADIAPYANGNVNWALNQLDEQNNRFADYFVQWVRMAFQVKKKLGVLKDIVNWTQEVAAWPRGRQKDFLKYCSEVFRMALVTNYRADALRFEPIRGVPFKWEGFYPYIHGANIQDIVEEINTATFHIDRNANAKLVFLDATLKMTRFLHKKSI